MEVIQDNRVTAFIGYTMTYLRNRGYDETLCSTIGTLAPVLFIDSDESVWGAMQRLRASLDSLENAKVIPKVPTELYNDLVAQLSGLYRASHWDLEEDADNE